MSRECERISDRNEFCFLRECIYTWENLHNVLTKAGTCKLSICLELMAQFNLPEILCRSSVVKWFV